MKPVTYVQLEHRVTGQENVEARTVVTPGERLSGDDSPNKVSEDIMKCFSSIFLRTSSMKNKPTAYNLPFSSTLVPQETCVLDKYLQLLHDECKPASFYKMSNILSFKFQIV